MPIVGMRNSYIAGGVGTSDALNPAAPAVLGGFAPPEIRPKNWRETLLLLYPNSSEAAKAPLTALTSMMKSESTDDAEFNWFEKILDNRRVALTVTLPASSAGAVTVAAGAFKCKAGDLLYVEATKEVLRVTADPTTDTGLTVARNFTNGGGAGSLVTVGTDNPNLTIIGSAFEEGSAAPSGVNFDPTRRFNYCQIFRSTLELTRTASKTRLRTGDAVKEAKRECLELIGVDMERAFWFGQKSYQSIGGKPARTSDGILRQIQNGNTLAGALDATAAITNGKVLTPVNGLITMVWLDAFMELAFRFGSNEKLLFGGNPSLLAIQQCVRKNTSYQIHFGEKEYGMQVARLTSPFGTLVMKTHPLFNQMTGGTAPVYTGAANMMVVVDAAQLRYRYVDDLKYQPDLTAVGLDGMKSGYLAECGLELHHPNAHIYAEGIVGGTT